MSEYFIGELDELKTVTFSIEIPKMSWGRRLSLIWMLLFHDTFTLEQTIENATETEKTGNIKDDGTVDKVTRYNKDE